MSLSKEFLDASRGRLEEELKTIESELSDLGFPDGRVEVAFDEGFADAAQTTSERAKVLSLAEGMRTRLEDIKVAMDKLDKGKYGYCERCGEQISEERLEAIPTSRLCITCKQRP